MKRIFCLVFAILMGTSTVLASGLVTENAFAASSSSCSQSFLGLKPWFDGLELDDKCNIKSPTQDELPKFIWTIVLNIIYDIMLIVGVVAVGFIIYGGYMFIISGGDTGKVAKAKNTLTGAVIGLLIAVFATIIINTIMGVLIR